MYNVKSLFPENVDDLIFYQDVSLSNLSNKQYHESLIKSKRYTDASKYLKEQSNLHSYSAGLFNLIQNRIYCLQKYLQEKQKYNPHYYSSTAPETIKQGEIWVDFDITKGDVING